MRVGVLALQGGVAEHLSMLERAGARGIPIRNASQLAEVEGLILPGGESTAIGRLLHRSGLAEAIIQRARGGMPVWGTCAGMILLAREIAGEEVRHLGLMDIRVRRNAYGGQLESFIAHRVVPEVAQAPLPLVFIRAPYIEAMGPGVRLLLDLEGKTVAARQEHLLATAFHPELTDRVEFHRYFVQMVSAQE